MIHITVTRPTLQLAHFVPPEHQKMSDIIDWRHEVDYLGQYKNSRGRSRLIGWPWTHSIRKRSYIPHCHGTFHAQGPDLFDFIDPFFTTGLFLRTFRLWVYAKRWQCVVSLFSSCKRAYFSQGGDTMVRIRLVWCPIASSSRKYTTVLQTYNINKQTWLPPCTLEARKLLFISASVSRRYYARNPTRSSLWTYFVPISWPLTGCDVSA